MMRMQITHITKNSSTRLLRHSTPLLRRTTYEQALEHPASFLSTLNLWFLALTLSQSPHLLRVAPRNSYILGPQDTLQCAGSETKLQHTQAEDRKPSR
jgi:hypothetical protein